VRTRPDAVVTVRAIGIKERNRVTIGGVEIGTHPAFIALIERSRAEFKAGQGIPLEEIERKYGIKTKPARKRSRRTG
jgi:hypothetical protein